MNKVIAKIEIDDLIETIVGGLVDLNKTHIVLAMPSGGTAFYPKEDLKDLKLTNEVFEMEDVIEVVETNAVAATETNVEVVVKEKKVRAPREDKGPSEKMLQVIEICKANAGKPRKEVIAEIVEKAGMTAAGASTYHQNAKKYL